MFDPKEFQLFIDVIRYVYSTYYLTRIIAKLSVHLLTVEKKFIFSHTWYREFDFIICAEKIENRMNFAHRSI